jgi:DNA repair exonuclease SbcCD ATPase subunit
MAEQMEKEISSLEATIKEKRDQYHGYDIQARSKLLNMSKRLDGIKASIDEDISKKLADAKAVLASREDQKDELSKKVKSADERMAVLKQRMEEKEAVERELSSAKKELERIAEEASQWEYLKHACGKTGLQALEIDGVAPLITGYANDLLTSSFGPNFSVKLITQDPETGKEVIDIIVIRGDGSETKLENLSGGEKVWVLKALRLAMTLVSKEKSGRNFKTILCDEEDGPLDTEKAVSFAGLYKSILEVGGFDSCFYISHNQDVIGMADHRIEFSRGGISIC